MNTVPKAAEPSMEEILASIRRIIAEDEKPAAAPSNVAPLPSAQQRPPAQEASPVESPVAPAAAPAGATVSPIFAPAPAPASNDAAPPFVPIPVPQAPLKPAPMAPDEIEALLAALDEPAEASRGAASAEAEILELTEVVEPQPVPGFQRVTSDDDVAFAEGEEGAPAAMPAVAWPEPPAVPEPPEFQEFPMPLPAVRSRPAAADPLLSKETDASVQAAFQSLASTILTQNARTIEDLVQDMLRPMLKTWLDDNLPGLVERLVRAEIERVSRGPR